MVQKQVQSMNKTNDIIYTANSVNRSNQAVCHCFMLGAIDT